ncbi:MAG: hypothetical protein JST35_01330 [Armatimonadetes bacterium]|nr:hypothetical protein [Armatimonadota bacterium]
MPERFEIFKFVDFGALKQVLRIREPHQRIYSAVDLYLAQLEAARREDDTTSLLWICYVPDVVYTHCQPKSAPLNDSEISVAPSLSPKQLLKRLAQVTAGQGGLFDDSEPDFSLDAVEYKTDFHHQLKHRLLVSQIPVQLIREQTIAIITDLAQTVDRFQGDCKKISALYTHVNDIAWNLSTALFYKACGSPWKVANLRPGVCYIGLVFKRTEPPRGRRFRPNNVATTACCAAQMFLDSGDGTVFKGNVGPWYSPDTKECHLNADAAESLISLALQSYRDRFDGEYPRELFIHGKTAFTDEEWQGFQRAVPPQTQLTGIRIKTRSSIRIYPRSDLVALRGVAHITDERHGLLIANGWIPRMQTYPGREVPTPLEVDVLRGDTPILTVLEDILKLTKLNYNSNVYGDGIPVTLRFADAIGSILTAGPLSETPPLPFKFYM